MKYAKFFNCYVCIAFFMAIVSLCSGAKCAFYGQVVDEFENPIPNVQVHYQLVMNDMVKDVAITDRNGRFIIEDISGHVIVRTVKKKDCKYEDK